MQPIIQETHIVLRVAYALYREAFCRKCMTNIAKQIVKVGFIKYMGPRLIREDWFHFNCLKELPQEAKKIEAKDVEGYSTLRVEDQLNFMSKFDELKTVEIKRAEKKRRKRGYAMNQVPQYQQKKIRVNAAPPRIVEDDPNNTSKVEAQYGSLFEVFRQSMKKMGSYYPEEGSQARHDHFDTSRQTDMIEFNDE